MFERFTDRARQVIVAAQEESRLLAHAHIGTEHLLLGLWRDPDPAFAEALRPAEVDLPTLRARVEELVGRGEAAPPDHVPFTPRAKHVLELSLREAKALRHDSIDSGHIMLGLLREANGVAARVLGGLGADLPSVRDRIVLALGGGRPTAFRQPFRTRDTDRRLTAIEERLASVESLLHEVLKRLESPRQ
ncbi:Clp protease N-terminal domain-containing protein [Actinomadura kijaniata]|uniref:Clp protease N-terminal domain-containing protein n=1 Tax=Actinomadura kijaniata TaxID=46161 RepID=UPI00082E9ADB|nr:Clp protease N-terminal domain-containing protein [Actinomadura kijaniata]